MNTKAAQSWWRDERTSTSSRKSFCLLVLPSVWLLAVVGYQTSQSWKLSSALSDEACELDSFSKPSLAAAILKQEAGRLFSAYLEQEEIRKAAELRPGSGRRPRPTANRQPPGPDQGPSNGRSTAAALEAPAIQSLASLRREAQRLNIDLDRMLLNIYYENRSWNAYLDCYLGLLQAAPENPLVLSCAKTALLVSRESGRTDETLDAMQHLTRFPRDARTARGLKDVVEEWGMKNPRSVEAGAR
jgi:hypothetical protein